MQYFNFFVCSSFDKFPSNEEAEGQMRSRKDEGSEMKKKRLHTHKVQCCLISQPMQCTSQQNIPPSANRNPNETQKLTEVQRERGPAIYLNLNLSFIHLWKHVYFEFEYRIHKLWSGRATSVGWNSHGRDEMSRWYSCSLGRWWWLSGRRIQSRFMQRDTILSTTWHIQLKWISLCPESCMPLYENCLWFCW